MASLILQAGHISSYHGHFMHPQTWRPMAAGDAPPRLLHTETCVLQNCACRCTTKYICFSCVTASDLVAVFDGGQECDASFFTAAVAALGTPGGPALVATGPSFAGLPDAADIFDLASVSTPDIHRDKPVFCALFAVRISTGQYVSDAGQLYVCIPRHVTGVCQRPGLHRQRILLRMRRKPKLHLCRNCACCVSGGGSLRQSYFAPFLRPGNAGAAEPCFVTLCRS